MEVFDKSLLEKLRGKAPIYIIGIDTYDKSSPAYCLVRRICGATEIILTKTMRDEKAFDTEVKNLARYFNAEIVKEKTYENHSQNSPRYPVGIEDRKTPDKDQGDVPEREIKT